MLENCYSPQQLAKLWSLHPETIRRRFIDMPGVLKLPGKKGTLTLRIPESIALRYSREISN